MNMKRIICLCVALCLAGCSEQSQGPHKSHVLAGQESDLASRFKRLLLSDTPLRYNDAHSFLAWLDHEAKLSKSDTRIVRSLLRRFLERTVPREVDPTGGCTGVAPPEAVLRAYAVRLLGKFGDAQDIPFLKSLGQLDPKSLPAGFQYPSWKTI